MNDTWKGKRVLVVGMARSGRALAALLLSLGATAVLSDTKPEMAGIDALVEQGGEARLGEPAHTLVAGCDAVIVSPAVPLNAPVILEAQRLYVPVLAELEFAARLVRGTQIAITGTNGKTTTTSLVGEMLKNAGKRTHVAGNIGLPLSAVALDSQPEDYTVIEVSSFQLEHMPAFHPQVAALLNLTPDHLNRHGTMEAYGALKEGMLRNQEPQDVFVYNENDAFCRAVAARAKARTVPFSRMRALDKGAWVEQGQLVLDGRILCPAEALSLPGPHNLENALAASAIAAQLGIPDKLIDRTLRTFAGVEHRMETVRTLRGIRFINDSKATNQESSMHGVAGMTAPTVLIAGGDEKGTDFSLFIDAIVQNRQIIHVVLIGKTAERLREALDEAGYTACTMAGYDFEKAVTKAYALAQAGGAGVVLMSPACASFDMFSDFEARGNQFKELVNALT